MTVPHPISEYLNRRRVDYSILKHKPTPGALEIAQVAAIPLEQLARSILLRCDNQPERLVMALIPASLRLDLAKIEQCLGEQYAPVAGSSKELFYTRQPHIIPGLGQPFNVEMVVDQRLMQQAQVYLEDGDNTELIKLKRSQFQNLMADTTSFDLCCAQH